MDAKEKIREGWIHLNAIIEILGKPKDYVDKVIHEVVESIKKEKTIEVLKEKCAEPKEQEKEFFSTFAELEILVKDAGTLQSLIFSYMPSSIEILSPAELKISLNDANLLFNDLSARLHQYDAVTKKFKMTALMLAEKLKGIESRAAGAASAQPEQKEEKKETEEKEKKSKKKIK